MNICVLKRILDKKKAFYWMIIDHFLWYFFFGTELSWASCCFCFHICQSYFHLITAATPKSFCFFLWWSFARGQPLCIIICKRPVPPVGHLQLTPRPSLPKDISPSSNVFLQPFFVVLLAHKFFSFSKFFSPPQKYCFPSLNTFLLFFLQFSPPQNVFSSSKHFSFFSSPPKVYRVPQKSRNNKFFWLWTLFGRFWPSCDPYTLQTPK